MGRIDGKIALVTGAASGIGRATAERFALEGATVVLADRADDRFAEVLSAPAFRNGEHRGIRLDVTNEAIWSETVKEIERTHGRLDVLVNNVGYGRSSSIADMALKDWQELMTLNLDSVFLGVKYSLPLLARSGHGSIVNVSSIAGLAASPGANAYAAAKAAIGLLTKTAALECAAAGNGVRANTIYPGNVDTPFFAPVRDDPVLLQAALARIPLGRIGTPEEIAAAILFLASDESSFMTGADLVVDGGYTAQ